MPVKKKFNLKEGAFTKQAKAKGLSLNKFDVRLKIKYKQVNAYIIFIK